MSNTKPPDRDAPVATPLTIERRSTAGATILAVAGEVDMTTYELFCQAFVDEAERPTKDALTLDLTAVAYMDAHSWSLIVQVQRQLKATGRPFLVRLTPSGQPERVCRLLKLDRFVSLS